jgi:hypothetical protein
MRSNARRLLFRATAEASKQPSLVGSKSQPKR